MSESDETAMVIEWFRLQYPKTRIIGSLNGAWIAGAGNRKFALISKYKKEGLTPGVSDLFVAHVNSTGAGLWLEMKDRGKTKSSLSQVQREWMQDMIDAGYHATWAAGADEAMKIISAYMEGQ